MAGQWVYSIPNPQGNFITRTATKNSNTYLLLGSRDAGAWWRSRTWVCDNWLETVLTPNLTAALSLPLHLHHPVSYLADHGSHVVLMKEPWIHLCRIQMNKKYLETFPCYNNFFTMETEGSIGAAGFGFGFSKSYSWMCYETILRHSPTHSHQPHHTCNYLHNLNIHKLSKLKQQKHKYHCLSHTKDPHLQPTATWSSLKQTLHCQ